jgi:hypothetical protein
MASPRLPLRAGPEAPPFTGRPIVQLGRYGTTAAIRVAAGRSDNESRSKPAEIVRCLAETGRFGGLRGCLVGEAAPSFVITIQSTLSLATCFRQLPEHVALTHSLPTLLAIIPVSDRHAPGLCAVRNGKPASGRSRGPRGRAMPWRSWRTENWPAASTARSRVHYARGC